MRNWKDNFCSEFYFFQLVPLFDGEIKYFLNAFLYEENSNRIANIKVSKNITSYPETKMKRSFLETKCWSKAELYRVLAIEAWFRRNKYVYECL